MVICSIGLLLIPDYALAKPLSQTFDITEQCFAVADERDTGAGEDSFDTLVRLNRTTGRSFVIGLTGTRSIESIAFGPDDILYAANGGQLGTLDITTGLFTAHPERFGIAGGSAGEINLRDVDGLTYDLGSDILYGVHRRRNGNPDLLFIIDRDTGVHVPDAFGVDADYVEVSIITDRDGNVLDDVDDIAVGPLTDIMFAAINRGGSGGVLATINRITGEATRVATFRYPDPNPNRPETSGQVIDDIEGLAFFNDGQMYGSTGDNGPDKIDLNRLFRIDKETGIGTQVGAFPAGHMDYEALGCLTARFGIQLEKSTNGPGQAPEDADEPPGPVIQVGDTVTWTYAFTNTSVFTLTDFVLIDDQIGTIGPGGLSNCPPAGTVLAPGEGLTCTATGIAQSGQYTNLATITGITQEGLVTPSVVVTDTDPSHYFGESLAIDLEKLTNGQDADDPNGTDVPLIMAGDAVTWTYIITNTGNTPFDETIINVTDDIVGAITTIIDKGNGDTLLAPGESWTYQAVGTVVDLRRPQPEFTVVLGCDPAQSGSLRFAYSNIGTVTAGNAAAIDPSHYCNPRGPAIDVEKLTNGQDADSENGSDVPQIGVGETVTWTYRVTNIGNVSFNENEVTVTDDTIGPVTTIVDQGDGDAILAPDEVWIYEAVGVAENLRIGQTTATTVPGCDPEQAGTTRLTYRNIGTVSAQEVTDADPSHYCNPAGPAIDIEKQTNGQDADGPNDVDVPSIQPGAIVTWTYAVTNTGNVPFAESAITVTDNVVGVITTIINKGNGDTVLDPNEVWLYQAVGVAENLLTFQSDIATIPGCNPALTGLARTAYRNIGTVVAQEATDSDPSHYCNPAEPGIDINKLTNDQDADGPNDADVPSIQPGATVTWTYVVTNTGNVPFAENAITVTDNVVGAITTIVDQGDGDPLLEPGEVWLYQATGVAENLLTFQSDIATIPGCDPAQTGLTRTAYRNIGTVIAQEVTDNDPSHYCNPAEPGIDINKQTNGQDADGPNDADVPSIQPGATVTWTYVVTNTGNVPFAESAITVTDNVVGAITTIVDQGDGDTLLEPGEVWLYQAVGVAENLLTFVSGTATTPGCDPTQTGLTRTAYRNTGTVVTLDATDFDTSHYCNPAGRGIDIEKWTNGQDADDPNGANVPLIRPGDPVTWTYAVTNTGNVPFPEDEIAITDNVVGSITTIVDKGDGDTLLGPGEVWLYQATGVAENLLTFQSDTATIPGCDPAQTGAIRTAYRNIGTVVVFDATDFDFSHYCNPFVPTALDPEEEPGRPQGDAEMFLPLIWQ